MKHINKFQDFLNETLKSNQLDVVSKKLDNFFQKRNFNKKGDFLVDVKSPYYQIVNDRHFLKQRLEGYKDNEDDLTKRMIEKGFNQEELIKQAQEDLDDFKYGDVFIFTDYNTPEIANELLNLIESIGYFVSVFHLESDELENLKDKTKIKEELEKSKRISIAIEPYFDDKVKFDGEYLYHTADSKTINKIMKHGLIPKTKNTRSFYPKRVYLSPNLEWMESIKQQLKGDKQGDYVDLKIKNFEGLSLYKDVRFNGGFYTYDNIHPKYIEVIN